MNKKKKILVISLSAGAGHLKAAEAVAEYSREHYGDIEATHIDMIDYVPSPIKTLVVDTYDLMVKKMPSLWGFFYDKTDKDISNNGLERLTSLAERFSNMELFKYIAEYNPDYILCTHFFPAYLLKHFPREYKINCPIGMLITDYDIHELWIAPKISQYFVATEKMKWKLENIKKVEGGVVVSGIPISKNFTEQKNIGELKKKYGVKNDGSSTILVLSGGYGMAKIDKIVKTIVKTNKKMNIFAIAGKNKNLENKLKKIQTPNNIKLKVFGWTDKMDEFMRISDVVITKPGGLTITECVNLDKKIIAIDPIPGQEEKNAFYIMENNLGTVTYTEDDLLYYLEFHLKNSGIKKPEIKNSGEIIMKKIIEKL